MWELDHKESWTPLNTKELVLLNCGVGEDSWESLGLQGDPTSPSLRRSVLGVHWRDWCWSWNSSTLAPDVKSWLIWRDLDAGTDWGQEEKETTEDEMVGWHQQLNGHGFGWTPGVGDGLGGWHGMVHGVTKSWTRLNDWTNWTECSTDLTELSFLKPSFPEVTHEDFIKYWTDDMGLRDTDKRKKAYSKKNM